MIRGTYPYYKAEHAKSGTPLVHSTDVRNNTVTINGFRGVGTHPAVSGPAILLPRVGRLTPGKIGVYYGRNKVMLSDCIIALKPSNRHEAVTVRKELADNFDGLVRQYSGTGAPFITLARLRDFLDGLGVQTL